MNGRSTTPEQLLARTDNPEWETAEGRVLDEVTRTIVSLSQGEQPHTVLAGLILNGRFVPPATEEGRRLGEISALGLIDPAEPNHRGDTPSDVLADLIEVGMIEYDGPNLDSPEALLAESRFIPRYKLVAPLSDSVHSEAQQ